MLRRKFPRGLGAGVAGPGLRPYLGMAAQSRPPNLVMLVSDDYGWPFYGFMGSVLPACEQLTFPTPRTPTLDRLVNEGICFYQGSVTEPSCQPSRVDRDRTQPARSQQRDVCRPPARWVPTIPVELAERGYRTLGRGKWNVGGEIEASFTENDGLRVRNHGRPHDSKALVSRGDLTLVDRFSGIVAMTVNRG